MNSPTKTYDTTRVSERLAIHQGIYYSGLLIPADSGGFFIPDHYLDMLSHLKPPAIHIFVINGKLFDVIKSCLSLRRD